MAESRRELLAHFWTGLPEALRIPVKASRWIGKERGGGDTAMAGTEKRKQSLYFPDDMLNEIMKEAIRLDRSLSWMVQRAWSIAAEGIGTFPALHAPEVPRAPRQRPLPAPAAQRLPAAEPMPGADPERQPGSQVLDFISGKFENRRMTT